MKQKIRLIIDILMTLFLYGVIGYQFFSQETHEWFGVIILLLFITHNLLNIQWYKNLLKNRYTTIRTVYLIIDGCVLISMFIQMYSGIAMSRYIFSFCNIPGSMSLVRRMHVLGAYWGFLFISLHLGIHWAVIIRQLKKNIKESLDNMSIIFMIISATIAIYGMYAFYKRNFPIYLFLRNEFVFMDFNELKLYFYFDYLMIMGLCIFIAHYGMKFLINKMKRIKTK